MLHRRLVEVLVLLLPAPALAAPTAAALPVGWLGFAGLMLAIFSLGMIALGQAREIQRLRRAAWDVAAQLDADAGPYRTAGDPRGLTTGRAAAAALRALLVLCMIFPRAADGEKKGEEKGKEKPKKEEKEKKKEETPKKPCKCKHVVWELSLLIALLPLAGCAFPSSRDGWMVIGGVVAFAALLYLARGVPND